MTNIPSYIPLERVGYTNATRPFLHLAKGVACQTMHCHEYHLRVKTSPFLTESSFLHVAVTATNSGKNTTHPLYL